MHTSEMSLHADYFCVMRACSNRTCCLQGPIVNCGCYSI